MPSGPVAQWIRHRPTELGIVGSSPTRIIWLFHSVTAEKPGVPTATAAEMAGSSGHTEIPDSPKRCLSGRGGLKNWGRQGRYIAKTIKLPSPYFIYSV